MPKKRISQKIIKLDIRVLKNVKKLFLVASELKKVPLT